jgi:ribosomal protein L27
MFFDTPRKEPAMARKGGLTSKFYRETRGIKVAGGQQVKCGTILTRQGDRWKPGVNVLGRIHLTAACDGEVYFTKKRGLYGHKVTYVHIRALETQAG